jgi:NAD(P)-dependent dehydrogenase (short-subunit alcohol dehydrogenase family)
MSETGLTGDGHATRRGSLITGASGGIGADLARVFARHRHARSSRAVAPSSKRSPIE